jgi:integrase
MSITEYEKDGKKYYKVYAQSRGKEIKRIRFQKSIKDIEKLSVARREEKRLIRELTTKVAKLEGRGLLWSEVIERWETAGAHGHLGGRLNRHSIRDHLSRLRLYTKPWMKKVAAELTRGDGRRILEYCKSNGVKPGLQKRIKNSINTVYTWGIEEGLIRSGDIIVNHSPVYGLSVEDKVERNPPILTLEEIRKILFQAKLQDHVWYPHWAFAVLSGMRIGELYALQWSDIDEDNGIIRVTKSYNKRIKELKSTKSGKWRNVNISPQLKEIITYLRNTNSSPESVLPKVTAWGDGQAGKILRLFMKRIGIDKYATFHTLRACFATHLLASGAEPMKVMKMGGWSDLKTFQIYIRMAGVDVKGVSDTLDVLPNNTMANVISINK